MTTTQRDIHVDAAPDEVWEALVAQGQRHWYFQLHVTGSFEPGGQVSWGWPGDSTAEEAEVIVADRPHRLELRTHYKFAPNLAAEPPHLITWEIESDGAGSHVTLAWDAGPQVSRMLEAEGLSLLRGLRLAVDPAAAAELARLPVIGEVTVLDVTPERVADYQSFFDNDAFRDYPAWQSCYCMETHRTLPDEEWTARTSIENRADMTSMIGRGQVTGLLAYVDGKPVGWCNYGETTLLSGVMMKLKLDASERDRVGSVACFVIASQYRGHGVATRLLDAAIDRLRDRGLRAVEAYPRKEGGGSAQAHYRGSLTMFERAGFETYRDAGKYLIVRKPL